MAQSKISTGLTMDVSGLVQGVAAANASLKRLEATASSADKSLSTLKFIEYFKIGFAGLTKVLGKSTQYIKRAFRQIENAFTGAIDVASQVKKEFDLSQAIGVSYNYFQALKLGANEAGIALEQLYEPLSKLPRKISDAVDRGSKDVTATFKQLGIDPASLVGLGIEQQFNMVADAINKLPLGEQQTVINRLFEESGNKFRQLINLGSEGMQQLKNEAKALNMTLSDETLDYMNALGEEVRKVGYAWEGLKKIIVGTYAPKLVALLRELKDFLSDPKNVKWITDGAIAAVDFGLEAISKLVDIFVILAEKIQWLLKEITNFSEVYNQLKPSNFFIKPSDLWKEDPQGGGGGWGGEDDEKVTFDEMMQESLQGFKELVKQFKDVLSGDKKVKVNPSGDVKGGQVRPIAKPVEELEKTVKEFSRASNQLGDAASKLIAAEDIRTSAGQEAYLKSFEDNYGEPKEVRLLEKIATATTKLAKDPPLAVA